MNNSIIESTYPAEFRKNDAKKLAQNINKRRSVVLIGMKRVGISNFLRFFLYHKYINLTYFDNKHLFIPVDLNDLVEREIFPFWILTFKRIADNVEKSDLPEKIKKQIAIYFLDSIQSQDLFLTIDYLRKSLIFLAENEYLPTIFFIRFDRIKPAINHEFFGNIQGLIDATHGKLSYVFTSDHSLDQLEPNIFTKQSVSVFSDNIYIKPAEKNDTKIIFESSVKQFNVKINEENKKNLLRAVDGHTQYLLFGLICLSEIEDIKIDVFNYLKNDERISLQSEELWESLSAIEQDIILKVLNQKKLNSQDCKDGSYLINTGFINTKNLKLFNPIFEYFVKIKDDEKKKEKNATELSKKEHLLLSFLEKNKNRICEREEIIENVWPEAESLGVTDWAIDRLVARLRAKMNIQNKKYEIVTIKTRGYKLIIS